MNTINLSEEKYSLFCFLTNEITTLREQIPLKPNQTRDYKLYPNICCKITIIINYIHEYITKNKIFLKRKIGTVYEYLSIWTNLIKTKNDFSESFLSLQKENFILTILSKYEKNGKKFEKTNEKSTLENQPIVSYDAPDVMQLLDVSSLKQTKEIETRSQHQGLINIPYTYITSICEKYINNDISKKEIYEELINHFKNTNLNHDLLLIKLGSIFPRYVLRNIFTNFYSHKIFTKKLQELNVPEYWTSEKLLDHGKKIGQSILSNRIKTSDLMSEISKFKTEIVNSPKTITNPEQIFVLIENEKKENKKLSYHSIVKYFWYLFDRIKVKKIIYVLGITYPVYYKLKKELISDYYRTNFESFREKIDNYEKTKNTQTQNYNNQRSPVGLSPLAQNVNPGVGEDIATRDVLLLPSGDLQVIFKYGTPEHKKYLCILNGKT